MTEAIFINRGIKINSRFQELLKEVVVNRIVDMVDQFWIKTCYVELNKRQPLVEQLLYEYAKLGCAQLSTNPDIKAYIGNYTKAVCEKDLPSYYSTIVDAGGNLYFREGFGSSWRDFPESIINMLEKYWIYPGYISNDERGKLISVLIDMYHKHEEVTLSTNVKSPYYVGKYVKGIYFPQNYQTSLKRNGVVIERKDGKIIL